MPEVRNLTVTCRCCPAQKKKKMLYMKSYGKECWEVVNNFSGKTKVHVQVY